MEGFTISIERRQILGFQLKRRRIMREMSIGEVHYKTGINRKYIKALENGKITLINPKILIKLGDLLGIHYLSLYMIIGYIETYDCAKVLTNFNYYNWTEEGIMYEE